MTPESMLYHLGIEPLAQTEVDAEGGPDAEGAQGDDEDLLDLMAPRIIDPLFKDESVALRTLAGNYDRLVDSIKRIAKSEVFRRGKIGRVADLGGGSGLIGMWLVNAGLCESCDIYDHAKNPLLVGEKWASDLGLTGVVFYHQSFADIGKEARNSYDFVFAEHALPFGYMQERISPRGEYMSPKDCPFMSNYLDLATAFRNLLSPHGVGRIGTGHLVPVCASALSLALRQQSLAVNWKLSSNRDGLQLFLNAGTAVLFESPEEDALALLSDMEEREEFSKYDVLSLEKIFQHGRKYFDVCFEEGDSEYRCTVFQFAGLAGLFRSGSNGSKKVEFHGAGRIPELAKTLVEETEGMQVLDKYVDSRLASILASP